MCTTLNSHIVDSQFYRKGYTTDEARAIFCDLRRMQRWLDVEAALALAQADLALIPTAAAKKLQHTAKLGLLNTKTIKKDISETGHSLVPLLNAWHTVAGNTAGQYIHFGATTQDIQDTAQSLELHDVFDIVERDLVIIIKELVRLAEKYIGLVMIGRTHGQHALPTTFGLKISSWLDELLRSAQRLAECKKRLLVSQLFGGVGTMAAFGDKGLELLANFSARLQLNIPQCAWHSARDRLVEFQANMAILAGGLARIANEICQLSRNEISELEEPFHFGKIGSSTMPHKRNPEMCEQVVVLAKLIKANAGMSFDTLINEHERDYRSIRLEWVAVTEASLFLCGALHHSKAILKNLIVDEKKIKQNTANSANLISTEALMFTLAKKIGKQKAHQLIYEVSMQAHDNKRPIITLIMERDEVSGNFTLETLNKSLAQDQQVGLASQITNQTVSEAKAFLATRSNIATLNLHCPLADKKLGCTVGKR